MVIRYILTLVFILGLVGVAFSGTPDYTSNPSSDAKLPIYQSGQYYHTTISDIISDILNSTYSASGHNHSGTYDPAGTGATEAASAVSTHAGEADPHTGYMLESNIGTGANNYVQLDGTGKLPAVDGSQLTNLPGGGTDDQTAAEVSYSNATSGLTATDTQAAVDEIEGRVDTVETFPLDTTDIHGIYDTSEVTTQHWKVKAFSGNPLIIDETNHRRDPSRIIEVSGTYYIYYTVIDAAATNAYDVIDACIGYATTTDITGTWTEQSTTLLCKNGTGTEGAGVYTPDVIVEGSEVHLFYSGVDFSDNTLHQIHVATATSPGGPFTRSTNNPVIPVGTSGAWDDARVDNAWPVLLDDGTYRVYYKGLETLGTNRKFGYTTASAANFPDTLAKSGNNPMFGGSTGINDSPAGDSGVQEPNVIVLPDKYLMLFEAPPIDGGPARVEVYESLNGINGWKPSKTIDWIDPGDLAGTWVASEHAGPAASWLGGDLKYIAVSGSVDAVNHTPDDSTTKSGIGLWILEKTTGGQAEIATTTDMTTTPEDILLSSSRNGRPFYIKVGDLPSGSGDVSGPGSSTDGYVPQWSGTSGTSLSAGFALSSFGSSTGLGLNNGSTYTNYGVAGDDSLNELFAAIDTALGTTGGGSPGSDGDVSYNNGGSWGKWAHWDDVNDRLGIGTDTPVNSIHVVGEGDSSKLVLDSYSNTATNSPGFVGRAAKGTEGTPAAVDASKYMFQLTSQGHDGSAWAAGAIFRAKPTETWTGSAHGAQWEIDNVVTGTTTVTTAVRIKDNDIEIVQPQGGIVFGSDGSKIRTGVNNQTPVRHPSTTVASSLALAINTADTTSADYDEVVLATSISDVVGLSAGSITTASGYMVLSGVASFYSSVAVTKGNFVTGLTGSGAIASHSATPPSAPAPRIKILETTGGSATVKVLIY